MRNILVLGGATMMASHDIDGVITADGIDGIITVAGTTETASTTTTAGTTTTANTTSTAGTIKSTGATINKTRIIQIHDKKEEIEKYNGKRMRLHFQTILLIFSSYS